MNLVRGYFVSGIDIVIRDYNAIIVSELYSLSVI